MPKNSKKQSKQSRSSKHRVQKGAGYNLPLEYFGTQSDKYYESGHDFTKPPSHLRAVSFGTHDSSSNHTGPKLDLFHHKQEPVSLHKQAGGASPYDKIVNPFTNRKVGVHTPLGRKILKGYLSNN